MACTETALPFYFCIPNWIAIDNKLQQVNIWRVLRITYEGLIESMLFELDSTWVSFQNDVINPLNTELNPICQ